MCLIHTSHTIRVILSFCFVKMPANRSQIWELIVIDEYERTKRMKCVYCDFSVNDNITRFKQHAEKCKKTPLTDKMRLIKGFSPPNFLDERESSSPSLLDFPMASPSQTSSISFNSSVSQAGASSSDLTKRRLDRSIKSYFDHIDVYTQDEAIKSLSKFFFKNSLPFNIINDEHFIKFCKTLRPSYVAPIPYLLKTTHLNREYEEVKKMTDDAIDEAFGVTIVINGWSNVRHDDIVNVILCTPKPYFFKSINTEDNSKTARYLKTLIDPIIDKYGAAKISAIVSDNASNMKKLGQEVNLQHKNIFFSGCCAHLLSLLIKDVVVISEFKEIFQSSHQIVKTVLEKPNNLHIYKKLIKETGGTTLKTYLATRFYGVTVMYKSLLDNVSQLKSFAFKENVTMDCTIQERIADFSKVFWPSLKLNYILLNKIANLIGLFESNEATLGDVVYHLNSLEHFVKRELDSLDLCHNSKVVFLQQFEKRFKAMVNEYTCLANVLHPDYRKDSKKNNLTVQQTTIATNFFETYAQSLGYELEELSQVVAEFYDYIGKNELYASKSLWTYKTEDPFAWWRTVSGLNKSGKLHLIAMKLLAVRPSNCDVERNFSIQKNIHTKQRNRLGDGTVEKLVL